MSETDCLSYWPDAGGSADDPGRDRRGGSCRFAAVGHAPPRRDRERGDRAPEPRARAVTHPSRRARVGHGRGAARRRARARGWTRRATSTTATGIASAASTSSTSTSSSYAGTQFMSYGQTMIQEDLYLAADAARLTILFEADAVAPATSPRIANRRLHPRWAAEAHRLRLRRRLRRLPRGEPARRSLRPCCGPTRRRTRSDGSASSRETPPLDHIVYCNRARGFALASQRNPMLSRYYVQCPLDDSVDDWPDDAVLGRAAARYPGHSPTQIVTGPSIEKSIAPLRSFVAEPHALRQPVPRRRRRPHRAAHRRQGAQPRRLRRVLPVARHRRALRRHDDHYLDRYSEMALRRVWAAVRFSWWMTTLLHRFPDQTAIDQRLQEAELARLSPLREGASRDQRAVRRDSLESWPAVVRGCPPSEQGDRWVIQCHAAWEQPCSPSSVRSRSWRPSTSSTRRARRPTSPRPPARPPDHLPHAADTASARIRAQRQRSFRSHAARAAPRRRLPRAARVWPPAPSPRSTRSASGSASASRSACSTATR